MALEQFRRHITRCRIQFMQVILMEYLDMLKIKQADPALIICKMFLL